MESFNIEDAALAVEYDRSGEFLNSQWNVHSDVLSQYDLPDFEAGIGKIIEAGSEVPVAGSSKGLD